MKKTCIFCARRANTDEDVIPRWIPRLLQKHEGELVRMRTSRFGREPQEQLVGESIQKVKSVCSHCNNGWMSRLEDEVKPILTPMILGNAVTLTAKQQERITTWMTKCAMVFESMATGEVLYNNLDRQHFRKTGSPLSATSAWLGQYTGGVRIIPNYRLISRQQKDGGTVKVLVLTLVFGELALQLTCAKWTQELSYMEIPTFILTDTKSLLVEVWPVNLLGVHWPPRCSFDDENNRIRYLIARFDGKNFASPLKGSRPPKPAP